MVWHVGLSQLFCQSAAGGADGASAARAGGELGAQESASYYHYRRG